MARTSTPTTLIFLLILSIDSSYSFPKWDGCPDLKKSDFVEKAVVAKGASYDAIIRDASMLEPIGFDFYSTWRGGQLNIQLFVAERRGKIKKYDLETKQMYVLHKFDTMLDDPTKENGMVGIALDPNFETNGWLYLYYTTLKSINTFRVARYTVKNNKIDPSSEKILLDIPINKFSCCHIGGGMEFDAYGDLWITTGDQADYRPHAGCTDARPDPYKGAFLADEADKKHCSAEWNASSTANLLGSVLRIHPDDKAPKGYTIPKGNFGEHWARKFEAQGNTSLANQYRDQNKVLPEIWAKGQRNPYTVTLDPVRRWIGYGDCGPDGPRADSTEESELLTEPSFAGWPYFAGNQKKPYQKNEVIDPLKPINDSPFNKGVQQLPPSKPALFPYTRACAMTGPLYRYDGDLQSDIKWPPHFNRHWFVTDFNKGWIRALTLDDKGAKVEKEFVMYPAGNQFRHLLLSRMGPDGAMYINVYHGYNSSTADTRITRLEYRGSCRPAAPKLEKAGCTDKNFQEYDKNATHPWPEKCVTPGVGVITKGIKSEISLSGYHVSITDIGGHILTIADVSGFILFQKKGTGQRRYIIPHMAQSGIHILSVKTKKGVYSRRLFNY